MTILAVTNASVEIVDTRFVLRAYGAVILSFLGGIQWGLAIRNSDGNARTRQGLTPMLALSVVPSLIGWAGLLVEETVGFGLLMFGFALVLFSDVRAVNRGMAPRWHLRLRYPLTGLVVSCLIIAAAYKP
jgi:hypothetical protein